MINWFKRLFMERVRIETHGSTFSHYRCHVVSRETWKSLEIGDSFEEEVVVEGFFDGDAQAWVLVTRPEV